MRSRLSALTTAGSLLLSLFGLPAFTARVAPPEPLIPRNFPDPDVSVFGGTYYGYATGGERERVPYAVARDDGGDWTTRGDALPQKPAWMAPGVGAWAPDVFQRPQGDYLMYFTGARSGDNTMCLGAAVAGTPDGPFTPVGDQPLVCEPRLGGNIDPASFVDADGSRYLLYKTNAHPSTIWLQPVAADGLTFTGPRVELLRVDRPDEGRVVEAPVLIKRETQYVLFYSANHFQSPAYQTRYATSPSLTGPYTKAREPLLDSRSTGLESPGGADVTGEHLYFHAWRDGGREVRAMYRTDLLWTADTPYVP
ncbi:glycoside hydrolase family 43 protein [Prauserella endophytica]|uniref:Glycoside hydrolase n=1 Tax=Prauserella endophytica TaxID=1592324 RepID=A0ABY2S8P3_9PSEU|nr:glycoside hydrolase family 43 protein [Prauserella endophytica]TKG72253.1 glycoside hydrolase [Prauserella endophytica]